MKASDYGRRGEFFLAGAGSPEVNGSYVQTNSEDEVVFYEKRPDGGGYLCGAIGENAEELHFVVTLDSNDSLSALGEHFEIAWVLKSHNAVSYYAAPYEEDSETPPLKGWIALAGLLPVPCYLVERPCQPPRDRTSKLDIIVEDEEREFLIPSWEPDYEMGGSVIEDETFDPFYGWDNNCGDDEYDSPWQGSDSGEDSSDLDDSDEVELPADLMVNFKNGIFGHKPKPNVERKSSDQDGESMEDGELQFNMDSDSSDDDPCIVRHDTAEFDGGSGRLQRLSIASQEGDLEDELTLESPRANGIDALNEPELKSSNPAYDSLETFASPVSLTNPSSPENLMEGHRQGSQVLRGGSHKELVIALPTDPFSTPTHTRYRRSRDYIDIDLVSAPPELLVALSPRRKSARRLSGRGTSDSGLPFPIPRRKSGRRHSGRGTSNDDLFDLGKKQESQTKKTKENTKSISLGEVVLQEEKSIVDQERLKLQREAHQLKTKMRKCDRISKIRKRGTTLSKMQQETLVNKSKYQRRFDEIRKLLGSDNIKS